MKRLLLIIFNFTLMFGSNQTQAYDYDPLLMRAQASIFPKIILLDKDLESKLENNSVIIEILHSSSDTKTAFEIKSLIETQYKNNLGGKTLRVDLNSYKTFDKERYVTAYFVLKGADDIHSKITSHAANKKRVVFSYDDKDFEQNTLISVLVKEKTYIYLNKSAIHDYDIKFLPLFYKIVKVIE